MGKVRTNLETQTYIDGELKNNIKEIRDDLKNLNANISKLFEEQGKLKHTVYGNGEKGLCTKVDTHEEYIQQQTGQGRLVTLAIGSGWLVTLLLLLVEFFKDKI